MSDELPEMGLEEALKLSEEESTELDKIFKLLLDKDNIAHNTDLTTNEITAFSVLSTLAKEHDLEVLKNFLQENLVLRVSKGRRGRKEWVDIIGNHLKEEDPESSGFRKYFSRR